MVLAPNSTVGSFLSWLAVAVATHLGDIAPNRDVVTLATFHQAKGLEWPNVFLVGLEDGTMPDYRAFDEDRLAEERRLLYVAITRAESTLFCTWARSRQLGDRIVRREASRFLEEAGLSEARSIPSVGEAGVAAGRLAMARSALGLPTAEGRSPIEQRVLGWRDGRARANRVQPDQILTSEQVRKIVENQPRDDEGLAAIVGPLRAGWMARELLAIIAA